MTQQNNIWVCCPGAIDDPTCQSTKSSLHCTRQRARIGGAPNGPTDMGFQSELELSLHYIFNR